MPAFAKLLRACRARTAYAKGHSWAVGLIRDETCANYPFKPGYVDEKLSPEMDRAANAWGGDIESWDYALAHAAVGKTMDFYVSSVGVNGELVTNVDIRIVSETEAVVRDCGASPFTVKLERVPVDELRRRTKNTVRDTVSKLVYYDRKGDEELPCEAIQDLISNGHLTQEELVQWFADKLKQELS